MTTKGPFCGSGLTQEQQDAVLKVTALLCGMGVSTDPWALVNMILGRTKADERIRHLARRHPLRYWRYWARRAWERITGGD